MNTLLTKEQQTVILYNAALASGMDGHVQTKGNSAAEKIMVMFGDKANTPRKLSFLYLECVDACFYCQGDKACCTFTAKWCEGAKDLDHLQDAVELIKKMLKNMQKLIDEQKTKEGTK